MRRSLPVLLLGLLWAGTARGQGVLVPSQADVPPLALRGQEVHVTVEDQVAVTKVVQTFRNDTDRQLEATYVFPVPKGASVKKFTMWVDGKEVPGELVEADQARQIYTEIVRRTQDPGLLEYVGNNLLRVRVFPVPARGEQKLSVCYTSVADSADGLVEYVYPLRADGKMAHTLEKFTLEADLKAQHPIQNVYSPSHPVNVTRLNDRHARVHFEGRHAGLDKDFQLYYTAGTKDVGLTTLLHRPGRHGDGYFMMLISPRAELAKVQEVPRDMVFVLDTSGSMAGKRIEQARSALKYCLRGLGRKDRFAVLHFATTVNKYREQMLPASPRNVDEAQQWVSRLEANGSTNINDALLAALAMRSAESGRTFTVVFFTDGQPTISETNPAQIVRNMAERNTAETRIFTFGVGDDVNAVLLDQLADKTRSVCTYVRENEDIEAKVSSLYAKISHPVLTNLKLSVGADVTLSEVYPPQLPDLFHGSQLVVLGRYRGKGHAAVTLTGKVGKDSREFVNEVSFPAKTGSDKAFVEDLWARRKVGYLLDQIRTHGEQKELKDEVVALAKKYGITTPYTSFLVIPDAAPPVAQQPDLRFQATYSIRSDVTVTGVPTVHVNTPAPVQGLSSFQNGQPGTVPQSSPIVSTPGYATANVTNATASAPQRIQYAPVAVAPAMQYAAPNGAVAGPAAAPPAPSAAMPADPGAFSRGRVLARQQRAEEEEEEEEGPESAQAQAGKSGVDLAVRLAQMRNQSQVGRRTVRPAAGRSCVKVRGVWIDEGFDGAMKQVAVKAMSAAYFRILERHAQTREVFRLGNRVVWVTPSGAALVIDPGAGSETLTDAEIDALFAAKK